MALIGEDCSIVLTFGTVANGVISWLSAGNVTGKAHKINMDDCVELTNTKALGDGRKKHRSHSGYTKIDIESLVGYTGWGFLQSGGSPVGYACQLAIKENSALSVPRVFNAGIVEHWKGDIASTEAQIESLSIMCDIDAS